MWQFTIRVALHNSQSSLTNTVIPTGLILHALRCAVSPLLEAAVEVVEVLAACPDHREGAPSSALRIRPSLCTALLHGVLLELVDQGCMIQSDSAIQTPPWSPQTAGTDRNRWLRC